jgi:hypothetical protein
MRIKAYREAIALNYKAVPSIVGVIEAFITARAMRLKQAVGSDPAATKRNRISKYALYFMCQGILKVIIIVVKLPPSDERMSN